MGNKENEFAVTGLPYQNQKRGRRLRIMGLLQCGVMRHSGTGRKWGRFTWALPPCDMRVRQLEISAFDL